MMARIRTIKPEFFTSEDIVSLTPLARLFYVSLWCEADREGRLKWQPKTLKMRYLPGDDCSIEGIAQELCEQGLLHVYEFNSKMYAEIPSFTSHQVINNREKQSELPSFDPKTLTRESGVDTRESGREGRKGREGKGKEHQKRDEPFGSDDEKWIFTNGLNYLLAYSGDGERVLKSQLEQWCKDNNPADVRKSIETAQVGARAKPINYVIKTLQGLRSEKKSGIPNAKNKNDGDYEFGKWDHIK